MKTVHQIEADITRRLRNSWHLTLTGDTSHWPHRFPLGTPTRVDLETRFTKIVDDIRQLHEWATRHQSDVETTNRKVRGTIQPIPTHITVTSIHQAAEIAGPEWTRRLQRGTERARTLQSRYPNHTNPGRTLRNVDPYTDLDFELLCTVTDWCQTNPTVGYTPRQVPIPGVHAKWLNTHQGVIETLTGKPLGLLPPHPPRIHFTYLDPTHRAQGHRTHDSVTVGDNTTPLYTPSIVIISENKDTAIHFPPVPGGIAVEGDGFGGSTAAQIPWITQAADLIYWGDIDAHGYEILNGFRQAGVPARSILMGHATYLTYQRWGTGAEGTPTHLKPQPRKPLPYLSPDERLVYDILTDPTSLTVRRIEQERIPLHDALTALTAALAA